MAVVETRISVWEALAGRAPGQPLGPADPGLWAAVVERLNPARARPMLRTGIEAVDLVSRPRRSPTSCSARPTVAAAPATCGSRPQEWQLAQLMDGTRTVARLVAEFARIGGRLAPDQVTRVVADLAGNRMLDELPVDAFRPLRHGPPPPLAGPVRQGAARRSPGAAGCVLADVDPLVGFLYRAGGRLLFTRVVAVLLALVAVCRPRRCSSGPGGAAASRSS